LEKGPVRGVLEAIPQIALDFPRRPGSVPAH